MVLVISPWVLAVSMTWLESRKLRSGSSGWKVATCQEIRSTQSMKGLLPLGCRFGCHFRCRSHLFCYWRSPRYQVDSEAGRPHFAACVKNLGRCNTSPQLGGLLTELMWTLQVIMTLSGQKNQGLSGSTAGRAGDPYGSLPKPLGFSMSGPPVL